MEIPALTVTAFRRYLYKFTEQTKMGPRFRSWDSDRHKHRRWKTTQYGTFGFYIGTCGLGWLWIVFFYPEVTGLLLEEIRSVFEHGYGRGMRTRR